MINIIEKNINKKKLSVESLINDIYLLPKWEKIKSCTLTEKKLFFRRKSINADIFRKFSARNSLEKYSIKMQDNKVLANMDLKVYKDSVYIINFNISPFPNYVGLVEYLLQTAIEKALYNTSEKEVIFNLTPGITSKNKIKKILLNHGFIQSELQSNYEKEMFGETFSIKAENNSYWTKRIKQIPILINK